MMPTPAVPVPVAQPATSAAAAPQLPALLSTLAMMSSYAQAGAGTSHMPQVQRRLALIPIETGRLKPCMLTTTNGMVPLFPDYLHATDKPRHMSTLLSNYPKYNSWMNRECVHVSDWTAKHCQNGLRPQLTCSRGPQGFMPTPGSFMGMGQFAPAGQSAAPAGSQASMQQQLQMQQQLMLQQQLAALLQHHAAANAAPAAPPTSSKPNKSKNKKDKS